MGHLTRAQRYTISVLVQAKQTQSAIAKAIGKSKSVISRELKRNRDPVSGHYTYEIAQEQYEQRQKQKPKKKWFTPEVQRYVDGGLAKDYSPEQIAGRAKLEAVTCVSPERIYQYIWADKKNGGTLFQHLRRKGRKYRKRGALKDKRGIIRNRVCIEERPSIVDEKKRFGDLEIDTVIGKNHKGALLTINDRATGLVWIELLSGKEAKPLTEATIRVLNPIKSLLKTITADNGKEFAEHEAIAKALDVNLYFAHPYHSWERGANENTNGLIRQYIPKGSSFKNIDNKEVKRIQDKLNNRPRKKLGFLSPYEYFFAIFAPILNLNINQKSCI